MSQYDRTDVEAMQRDFDGQFLRFRVCTHLLDHEHGLLLLRRAFYATKFIISRRGWRSPRLEELDPAEAKVLLAYHKKTWEPDVISQPGHGGSVRIAILLRNKENMPKFLPFQDILKLMLHKLAHFYPGYDHYLRLWCTNYRLLRELKQDAAIERLYRYVSE